MEGCGKARDGRRWESCERQTGFLDGTVQMNSRRVVPRSISPKALDIACHSLGKSPRWGGGGNAGSGGGDLLQAQARRGSTPGAGAVDAGRCLSLLTQAVTPPPDSRHRRPALSPGRSSICPITARPPPHPRPALHAPQRADGRARSHFVKHQPSANADGPLHGRRPIRRSATPPLPTPVDSAPSEYPARAGHALTAPCALYRLVILPLGPALGHSL